MKYEVNFNTEYLELDGKIVKVGCIENYFRVKNTPEYQKEVEKFAEKIIKMKKLQRDIYKDIKKFNLTIAEHKLEDDFIPFWNYFLSDVFKHLEKETAKTLKLCEYEDAIYHHYVFLNSVKFFTLTGLPKFSQQQANIDKLKTEMFIKEYEPYLQKAFKSLKGEKNV